MNFMNYLNWTLFFLLILPSCKESPHSDSKKKPNIILIMADDLGYETLGTYGSEDYQTPNLDKLAAEGMRFENCYSTPLCTPSRVQLMTGKYNFRNYIGFGLLNPGEKTFGHYLQKAGYKTSVVGKWQLLGNDHQRELAGGKVGTWPADAGFDDYCLWQVDQRGSRYKDPLLTRKGQGTSKFPGAYGPDKFVDHIEAFMESNKENPFFVYYPMVLTHDPFVPTPDQMEFEHFDTSIKTNDTTYFRHMVTYMDKLVGRIAGKADDLGIRENTLILFIGDNGTDRKVISRHKGLKIKGHKGYTTEGGTHVPFIANWKGTIQPGQSNPNLIDFTDFLPSLLQAAGAEIQQPSNTDGISFFPQLTGEQYKPRDWVFCDYNPHWGKFQPARYVQNTRWKLYASGEFYDILNDREETTPLNTETQPEEVRELLDQFKSVLNNLKP
ncbi:sulfatase-like hydrolase/transferase [Fulvivirgaceae bacterium BMA12]|uniref:Sulfatase-like hydrolase/transferase n=1 Tax=Agaribacillus aureus TaxID=3051825 RepID=A0ABT8L101_9BACT|nr:sulfatase-like hydrolase/transferase [Fulvivirgaceae bacterium BMA12]